MKTYIATVLLAATCILSSSCKQDIITGKGAVETVSRNVAGFSSIELAVPYNATVSVIAGSAPSILLKGHTNQLEHVRTDVDNGVLKIYINDSVHLSGDDDIRIEISTAALTALSIKGSSDVMLKGAIVSETFDMALAGSGDVKVENMTVKTLDAVIAGSGSLYVKSGTADAASFAVAGAGEINAFGLQNRTADVSIAGVGDVELSVSDKLVVDIAGAGDLKYKGQPVVEKNVVGMGDVQAVN